MKSGTYRSKVTVAVLMAALLVFPTGTFARGTGQAPKEKGPLIRKRAKSLTRFQQDWTNKVLNSTACTASTLDADKCKGLIAMQISVSCADFAQFYQNEASVWNVTTFALVLISAGFTGVGASATIASSTKLPKIFSTLGGTTGLGAVTSVTKANVTTDLSGIAAENALAVKLQTLLKDPATDYKALLAQGPAIVLQCATAGGTAAPAAAGAGAPGAPTIGTATATSVAFTGRPASEGVTVYTATASPGGKTWTGTSSPITVTGLTTGTYTFTVTATNSAGGAGPASQPSNSVIVP